MNENINILIVEDDVDINGLLSRILSSSGYNVKSAYSGSEAVMCLETHEFHLVILDLMLPAVSGEELISRIRKIYTMPVIVISAKTGQNTKIEVLELGADDFISKPFDINEVKARVGAQLRRYMVFSNTSSKGSILRHENLELNRETVEVTVNGRPAVLTAREFKILEMLMSYPNKVFTKSNLFELVWDDTYIGDDNTINVHVSNIRSKLAKLDPDTEYIHTVWGIGFKMNSKA